MNKATTGNGFFQHHGIWAPGVRAFRNLNFRTKALLISAVFLLPMALLATLFAQARLETIDATNLERRGVAYVKEATPLLLKVAELRRLSLRNASGAPVADTSDARKALDAQLAVVEALDKHEGATLGTGDALAKVRTALQGLAPASEGLMNVYASHVKLSTVLYDLISAATDGSGLTLDPELDTYHLMDASVVMLPRLIDEAARMRDLSVAAATSGQNGDIAAPQLNRLEVMADERSAQLSGDAAKVVGAHPDAKAKFDTTTLAKALEQLRGLATESPGSGGKEKADKLMAAGTAAIKAGVDLQTDMVTMLDERLAARVERVTRTMAWVAVAVLGSLAVAAYLFHALFLVMNGGLKEMRHHVDLMANGDLTSSPHSWGRDESADLMNAVKRMQSSLRDIVGQVRGSSMQIAAASGQIAQGAGDMSTRTEQAAASLQQTSASMTEISGTVSRTAEVVSEAASLANNNAQVAGEGGQVIGSMVQTMDQINTSSRRITDILGVIDGIAFQTNILALNAAVEAARAGEQGRGFAVVASEVRSLAQRSAAAAREIKTLIGTNVEKVDAGASEVRRAGATMTTIVGNADRIRVLLEEISKSAQLQSHGLHGIGGSVRQLDDSVQQNAALSEETAAAANSLSDQANVLVDKVARFKLPDLVS